MKLLLKCVIFNYVSGCVQLQIFGLLQRINDPFKKTQQILLNIDGKVYLKEMRDQERQGRFRGDPKIKRSSAGNQPTHHPQPIKQWN